MAGRSWGSGRLMRQTKQIANFEVSVVVLTQTVMCIDT